MIDSRAFFEGKRVIVMGLGLLGRGLGDTLFLAAHGAIVTVTDLKTERELASSLERLKGLDVELKLGGHDAVDFTQADMILRNADVPATSKYLQRAREAGVPIEMDESLFCKLFRGQVIGITGTRGKTTTTTLIFRILSRVRPGVHLAGNIKGHATLPLLDVVDPDDAVVLELSSWQLQGFHDAKISPNASVFTNIYPDHLNRYESMQDYILDKKAIYCYQHGNDFCVFNGDQPECAALSKEAPAGSDFFSIMDISSDWRIQLPGAHNRSNIAAAARLCAKLGVDIDQIRRAVEEFPGVEHRLQTIAVKNGVTFIDDATSTTPVSGCAALDAMGNQRVLLIAGGADKKLDPTPFVHAAAAKAHRIALLKGDGTNPIREGLILNGAADKIVGTFDSLKDAVLRLVAEASPGDVILLSPACASFGMFQNEFHRGETFASIVKEL